MDVLNPEPAQTNPAVSGQNATVLINLAAELANTQEQVPVEEV